MNATQAAPLSPSVYSRLSLMMVFQYAVWGLWLPVLGRFLMAAPEKGGLGFTGTQVGWIIGLAGSVGAVTAPFVAGQLADRRFSTERVLATLMFLGGAVKYITASQTTYTAWLVLSILYSVVYMPTLALTNSLAFAHLPDRERQFPLVRVWGTIGWIIASWAFPMIWLQTSLKFQMMPPFLVGTEVVDSTARLADALRASGIVSIFYGFFCFMLPHTPPQRNAKEPLAFGKAFRLLTRSSFAVLVIASLMVSIIHQIYFIHTSNFLSQIGLRDSDIGPAMTLGQFAEIGVMAMLGLMLKRLGFRTVITIGALAYFARYAVFGTTSLAPGIIVSSQVLHGFCYACFFAAAYIYVDRLAPADIRNSAQTVFGIIILGLGPVLSGFFLEFVEPQLRAADGTLNYSSLWYILAGIGLATAIGFALFFRDETRQQQQVEAAPRQEAVTA